MSTRTTESLEAIERKICDLAAEEFAIPRDEVEPHARLLEDLHCDSIDLLALMHAVEQHFQSKIPLSDMFVKALFTREPFRLCYLAEMVYLQFVNESPPSNWQKTRDCLKDKEPLPRNVAKPDRLRRSLAQIEIEVCSVTEKELGLAQGESSPASRLLEDLGCDSLAILCLSMELEEHFQVSFSNAGYDPSPKSIFTRPQLCLRDFAEAIYVQQNADWIQRDSIGTPMIAECSNAAFTQLGSIWWQPQPLGPEMLFDQLDDVGEWQQFRRRSDGMRCVLILAAEVEIGCDDSDALPDEQPWHCVRLDAFLIDAEPVSTTAYCRFLNSVEAEPEHLAIWFLQNQRDDRIAQLPIHFSGWQWKPISHTEMLPMMLVSWYGANAYSLWSNGQNWRAYRTDSGFLPSEAQWEYAAQGAFADSSLPESETPNFVFAKHRVGATYDVNTIPMAPVHHLLGVSRFGLTHMAGNVWQWCSDWYDEEFYHSREARLPNPINQQNSRIRSERGGSWVGPKELCRRTYRRGRIPAAFGRCLGFRCISSVNTSPAVASKR